MKNFVAFVFASLLAQSAYSATIVPAQANVCQRDMNAWGHASNCECPESTVYENRLGECIQGATAEFQGLGLISTEYKLVGATSMVMLSEDAQSVELVLTRAMTAQLQDLEAQGLQYRINGEALEADVSNPSARPVVIVNTIEAVGGSEVSLAQ